MSRVTSATESIGVCPGAGDAGKQSAPNVFHMWIKVPQKRIEVKRRAKVAPERPKPLQSFAGGGTPAPARGLGGGGDGGSGERDPGSPEPHGAPRWGGL